MRRRQVASLSILMVFLCGVDALAQEGGQAGAFLRRSYGPRALAMGSAYTALAWDASATYWNPAGLPLGTESQLFISHSFLSFDRRQTFGAILSQFSEQFAIGIGILNFGVDDIEGRDASGEETETFSSNEFSGMLSLSGRVGVVSFGITGKLLYHSILSESALGYGGDVGILLRVSPVTIGVVAQDILARLQWDTESKHAEDVPMTLRFGGALHFEAFPVTLSLEGMKVANEETVVVRAGGELRPVRFFGIRGGYTGNEPTFGVFLRLPSVGRFDYAATRDELSSTLSHHLALSIDF